MVRITRGAHLAAHSDQRSRFLGLTRIHHLEAKMAGQLLATNKHDGSKSLYSVNEQRLNVRQPTQPVLLALRCHSILNCLQPRDHLARVRLARARLVPASIQYRLEAE